MTRWPHSPSHIVDHPGAYILTAATYHKAPLFAGEERLDYLQEALLEELASHGWEVQAWAVFSNHYHVVGFSPKEGLQLTELTRSLHGRTARWVNALDCAPGRMVWYRCWDTRLTFEKSYLARLAYVHTNPVRHGLVARAEDYRWCSAAWFAEKSPRAFRETVLSFKTDRVNVPDDF